MKNKILSFALSLLAVLFANGVYADTWDGTAIAWTHGNGTEDDPYLIETAANLSWLSQMVNASVSSYSGQFFKLTTDINLNSTSWTGIGTSEGSSFQGTFDGDNHNVSGLNTSTALFRYVKNATIRNIYVDGSTAKGGIVFQSFGTVTMENCHSSVNVTNSGSAGGIISVASSGTIVISYCSNTGNIKTTTDAEVGGIIGKNEADCTVQSCYNSGTITGNASFGYNDRYIYAGGVIGRSTSTFCSIINSYNLGNVTATISVSRNENTSSAFTYNTYAYAGGIVGYTASFCTINKCYNNATISTTATTYIRNLNYKCTANAYSYSSGIIGSSNVTSTIKNSYNRNRITSTSTATSLTNNTQGDIIHAYEHTYSYAAGISMGSSNTNSNCYNTGNINASTGKYAIANGGVSYCYYISTCGGAGNGTSKDETELKSADMPTLLNTEEEVFVMDTTNVNDGYPVFNESSEHTININANNDEYGTVGYDNSDTDSIEIHATPNCGYRFVSWNDGDTENPRIVAVSQDTTFTAIFEAIASDTIIVHDTVTNIVYDTVINNIHDTITNTVYDTVTVRDSIMVTTIQTDTIYLPQYIYDTITNNIHDTTYITNVLNDTVYLPQYIYDTVTNNIYDTTYITNVLNDTIYLPQYIYDTITNNVHDTTYVTNILNDTVYLPQYIYDTVTNNIYDTTYITNVLNDTIYLPQYIYDTVTNTVYDTVSNTIYDTITQTAYDTTYIVETQTDTIYLPQYFYDTVTNNVHDTTYVTNFLNDTIYLPQYFYDTVINTVYDTMTYTIYDTVYIHDTIYVIETGIHELKMVEAKVYVKSGRIIVENAGDNMVYLFDSVGRILATKQSEGETMEFTVSAAGVYMVKVGEGKPHKVVTR